ncbi:hypothetical protein HPB50_017656 [Hyalomma asiaticum]|uniref:Uncharacterized protein n=1 Tax=Hyalomma asiaticum TaxID=266040 RepID=A0ACB7TLM7_HYAAI|nr:hypothetical protein HPB50_017656 [Hyalomma asiaticum]
MSPNPNCFGPHHAFPKESPENREGETIRLTEMQPTRAHALPAGRFHCPAEARQPFGSTSETRSRDAHATTRHDHGSLQLARKLEIVPRWEAKFAEGCTGITCSRAEICKFLRRNT